MITVETICKLDCMVHSIPTQCTYIVGLGENKYN